MAQRLGEVLGGIKSGVGRMLKLCQALSIWEKVVDERVGKHTEAVKIRNSVLYVSTSSTTWAQELSFLKNEFIEKFNAEAGAEVIKDIRFKAKHVPLRDVPGG